MKFYKLHTKADVVLVEAENRDLAFAKYFKEIAEKRVPIEKIGNLIMLEDDGEEYPFRTVPLLWRMGVIDEQAAIANIVACVGVSRNEARKMLVECGEKDVRLVPLIAKLALEEGKGRPS